MVYRSTVNDYLNKNNCHQELKSAYFKKFGHSLGLLKLNEGWLDTKLWLPVTSGFQVFLDIFRIYRPQLYDHVFTPEYQIALNKISTLPEANLLVLGGSDNYWHFMLDFLPRLFCLKFCDFQPGLSLGIADSTSAEQIKLIHWCMTRLGIDPDTIPLTRLVNPIIPFRNCFFPTYVTREIATSLWENAFKPEVPVQGAKRIFVTRGEARRRRLLNEPQIIALLQKFDFEIVNPGTLDFLDQVRAFSNAEVIIGCHGAALTNLLFAPRGGCLIELRPPPAQPFYEELAKCKAIKFIGIDGMPVGKTGEHHRNFMVSESQINDTLQEVI